MDPLQDRAPVDCRLGWKSERRHIDQSTRRTIIPVGVRIEPSQRRQHAQPVVALPFAGTEEEITDLDLFPKRVQIYQVPVDRKFRGVGAQFQPLQIERRIQVYPNVVAGGLQEGQDLFVQKERESLKDDNRVLGNHLLKDALGGIALHGKPLVRQLGLVGGQQRYRLLPAELTSKLPVAQARPQHDWLHWDGGDHQDGTFLRHGRVLIEERSGRSSVGGLDCGCVAFEGPIHSLDHGSYVSRHLSSLDHLSVQPLRQLDQFARYRGKPF